MSTLRNNEFHIWLKEKNKLGGQSKIPRLNDNREIVESILSIKRSQPVNKTLYL